MGGNPAHYHTHEYGNRSRHYRNRHRRQRAYSERKHYRSRANSQSVDPGEGVRIDFVYGAKTPLSNTDVHSQAALDYDTTADMRVLRRRVSR